MRNYLALAVVATLALGGAACSNDTSTDSAEAPAAASPVSAATSADTGTTVASSETPLDRTGANAADNNPADHAGATLRVGIKYDQPGLGLMTDGQPTGLDVDVAAYLAWKLGYSPFDIEWIETRSPDREEFLANGTVDLIVASYSITDERAEVVDFAGPYLIAGQDLLVRAADDSINSVNDLDGKVICEVPDSTSLERIQELLGTEVTIIQETEYSACVRRVVNGDADAVSTDDVILAGLAATDEFYGRVRVVGSAFSAEQYGIGLPQGSTGRCRLINEALESMVSDGSWQRFIDRHTAGIGYSATAYDNPPTPLPCE